MAAIATYLVNECLMPSHAVAAAAADNKPQVRAVNSRKINEVCATFMDTERPSSAVCGDEGEFVGAISYIYHP